MAVGSETEAEPTIEGTRPPALTICESRPGTAVVIEDGNTDGWMASDTTCPITR